MTRFARASGSKGSNEKQPEDSTSWQEMKSAMLTKPKNKTSDEVLEIKDEDVEEPSAEEIQNVWAKLVDEAESTTKQKKKKKKSAEVNDGERKRAADVEVNSELPVKKKKVKSKREKIIFNEDKGNAEMSITKETTTVRVREKKRRKEALKPAELIINGKPVKVAPFDGFIVQAEDAARLKELRNSMKSKGIPEDERERAIKLERRRAEKALARLRKKVCFHCRSTGHNLSECPQIVEDQRATGICYKCGSTEHTHFQCKVTRGDNFKFAECFICKEQGHIAKQCPDNPRGLYPRGGGCATCGDVTHLKKDCPKYLADKKDDDVVTVNSRNERSLEALEEDIQVTKSAPFRGKKLNKRIKF